RASPRGPRARLIGVGMGFLVLFGIVGARVVWLQTQLADNFIVPWDQWIVEERPLPARTGRILSRDGVVFAYDDVRYDVAVHYRWLEQPSDPVWLKSQVRQLLTREQRRDERLVQAAERKVQQDREELFRAISTTTGVEEAELRNRAAAIQHQVERMVAAVEGKREQAQETKAKRQGWPTSWGSLINRVTDELTTPPDRGREEPVILKEELESHSLLENVSLEVAAQIESWPNRFPGVEVRSISHRTYPLPDTATHIVGIRRVTDRQANDHPTGQSGLERQYHSFLTGTEGTEVLKKTRRGEVISRDVAAPSIDGQDLQLSLDSRLQMTAEKLLDEGLLPDNEDKFHIPQGAVLVAMDVWTGQLLTLACAPRPRYSDLDRPTAERWQQLLNDPRRPLFSRVTQMALPAGSVFKVVTAFAALEEGEVSPDDVLRCRGYLDRPDQFRCLIYRRQGYGHGDITLSDALCQSCNVFFFDAARRLGPGPLTDWASRCGFGEATGIDLPSEASGHLPRPGQSGADSRWYPGSTLQLSVGQGSLLVTPLQVVRLMAAIANGGYLVRPQLVRLPNGSDAAPKKIPDLDERTLATIREGLEKAVADPRGTAKNAQISTLTLAGKTGTAEVATQADHAWFAGYAPVEKPRIAFAVVIENGGSAGSTAVPIAREYLLQMLSLGDLIADD
ncbi:MAG: hypothetical protein KDA80_09805, partial [Planctomycetaceae bacterium]|nr:hypothetical protein [Planctomycetaceae bacterium]